MSRKRLGILAVAAVMCAACVLFLYGLGAAPLQDYDEATYAQVTREEVQSNNWLSFTHTGSNYFEKPPLYFWLAGVSEKILGESEFSLRLPSALSGIALVALIMLFAYELSGSIFCAALAGAILLTTAPVLETARQVRIDVPLSLWVMLSAYAFVRALRNPEWFLLFGVAAGLAVLTKDVVAVFAFLSAGFFALCFWRFDWLKNAYFWRSIGVFFLIVIPWHVSQTLMFGATFWREYIGFDVGTRAAEDIFTVTITNRDYMYYLANFALPWTQVFLPSLAALAAFWEKFPSRVRVGACASALSVFAVIAVFFASATKAPTYLIPLYPFAALALSLILWQLLIQETAPRSVRENVLLSVVVTVFLLIGFGSTIYNGFHFNSYYRQSDELAREEKLIGTTIGTLGPTHPLYVFETTDLGSVMFYSRDTHPLSVDAGASPEGFILLPSTATTSLEELYPTLKTMTRYSGKQLALLQVQ